MSIVELLQTQPGVYLSAVFIFGLAIGSFLNVLIYRLPVRMEQELSAACDELSGESPEIPSNKWFGLYFLSHPASSCPYCGHAIKAWENIPILSYLLLRGRCSNCGTAISPRYPLVELMTALLSVIVAWEFSFTWLSLAALFLTWGLFAMSAIDYEHQILPDVLTLPLLWLGLLLNLHGQITDIHSALYGALAGYLVLWLVYHLFLLLTGKEGMGYGDFKLLALLGAWLGWQMLPQILLISTLIGTIVGVSMILFKGRDHSQPIPFGPFLAAAGWIALLWGRELNQAYLQFAGMG